MKCFSMNLPFSALLAHGRKSIETRNHTMFADTEGDIVLLHCGQRTYPDGGVHREILRRAGMSDAEIDAETRLPSGFARGQPLDLRDFGEVFAHRFAGRADGGLDLRLGALGL